MPTSKRDLQFLRRMLAMIAVGVALELAGIFLYPPQALLRRLHKET